MYHKFGPERANALINWHALTGCDATCHISGKGKKGCFKAFMTSNTHALSAIASLGLEEEPSQNVLDGCEEYLCSLFCPSGVSIKKAKDLRWHIFKQLKDNQDVRKLPPAYGAWIEQIQHEHVQARVWQQDLVPHPICPNPQDFGWIKTDGKFLPPLSNVRSAPQTVLHLVKCNCKVSKQQTKCQGKCSCKQHNLVCTEM